MRATSKLGLAVLTVVAAMAFVGTSASSAKVTTQLCKVHTALVCPAGQNTTEIHLVNEGVGTMLSDLVDVLCLTQLALRTPLALAKPQIVHTFSLTIQNCGTTSSHDNCTITVEEPPLLNLLKTGLDKGTLTATSGRLRFRCEDIFGFIDIDCKYDLTGMELAIENQKTVANETPVSIVEGSGLCPEESTFDYTLVNLVPAYVLQ